MFLPQTIAFVASKERQISVNGNSTCFHPMNPNQEFTLPTKWKLAYANWVSRVDFDNFDIVEFCRIHRYELIHSDKNQIIYKDRKDLLVGLLPA